MSTKKVPRVTAADGVDRFIAATFTAQLTDEIASSMPPFVDDEARRQFNAKIRDWAAGYALIHIRDREWRQLDQARAAAIGTKKKPGPLLKLGQAARMLASQIKSLDDVEIELLAEVSGLEGPIVSTLFGPRTTPDVATMRKWLITVAERCGDLSAFITVTPQVVTKPKRGPKNDRAKSIALGALKYIFYSSTGRRPARSFNPYANGGKGQAAGAFRKFCVAAFQPLEPVTGLSGEAHLDWLLAEGP